MDIRAFHDRSTSTLTYLVSDPATGDAIVIDPVLDFDPLRHQTSTRSARALLESIRAQRLAVGWILETHVHADHLTAAHYLAHQLDARVAIGERIVEVQAKLGAMLGLGDALATDGRQFDRLLADEDRLVAGSLTVRVIATPGHTPVCSSFVIGDAVFTGDALFVEDLGTGRCDFPDGSAASLYHSIHARLYALPPETRVFVGHDYPPPTRELRYATTIAGERASNVMLPESIMEAEFVARRERRDAELEPPRLLFQSLQVNVNGGRLPTRAANGRRYLRIPLNAFAERDDFGGET